MYKHEPSEDKISQYYNNIANYQESVSLIKNIEKNDIKRKPIISSRHSHISYFADGDFVFLPYTDYDGLVRYSILNDVDFLFLQYRYISEYPFLNRFIENNTPEFVKILEKMDSQGKKIELYRLIKNKM
jgi:hypothetical protein